MLLPGAEEPAAGPEGTGFATVKVDAGGMVSFAGTLADGTRVTQRVAQSRAGLCPLYTSLAGGQGFLTGWLLVTNHSSNDIRGDLRWTRAASTKAKYYPAGFSNTVSALGARYVRPLAPDDLVVTLATNSVRFSGGNLTQAFANPIALGAWSKVTNLGDTRLSLTFTLSSGLFSG